MSALPAQGHEGPAAPWWLTAAVLGLAVAALFLACRLHASTLIYGRTAVWWLNAADYQAAHGNTTTAAVFYARAESATAGAKAGNPGDWIHRRAAEGLSRTAEVKP